MLISNPKYPFKNSGSKVLIDYNTIFDPSKKASNFLVVALNYSFAKAATSFETKPAFINSFDNL